MSIDFKNKTYYQGKLSKSELALRDNFVTEYLVDYDSIKACLRLGFLSSFAQEFAMRLETDPYVQRKIAEARMTTPADQLERDKQTVLATLRQATVHGPYNTRVAAATQLAKLIGMGVDDGQGSAEQELVDVLRDFAGKLTIAQ